MKKLAMVLAALSLVACSSMMPSGTSVAVTLSGAEEVPPTYVSGTGKGSFMVAADGSISGSVTTQNVAGLVAHIHQGARGKNGPVIIPLVKNGDTYSVPEGKKLTDAQMQAFKAGDLYVNVHTARHRGGEVRAQLQP